MRKIITVMPYDPEWAKMFEHEAALLKNALGENSLSIHHIGSTSVPGLCAKPKIDIIAVVEDTTFLEQDLGTIGYTYKGEFNIPFQYGFSKRDTFPEVNLHVYEEGNPETELNLLFRDYLRNHPKALKEYADLKLYLVSQDSLHDKNDQKFSGYTLGKDKFIKKILTQAGFKGLCMRFCTHYDEWDAARHFRQKYFFDKVPISDPYTWTFNHPEHVHFILYQGTEMMGYAHLQVWPEQRAALRIIVIDAPLRGRGMGKQFLELCERWLEQKGTKLLQTEASPAAYSFYSKQGYIEMPFNDPDKHPTDPQDIPMGKKL